MSDERSFPKAVEIVTVSLAAVVVGGVWFGAHATSKPPLALPTVMLIVGAVLLIVGLLMIARVVGFSWDTWVRVGRWALLAYVIAYMDRVKAYILNQEEHHTSRTFQDEFRELLRRHGVQYDKKYLWE